jgi:predicted acetyltransferase
MTTANDVDLVWPAVEYLPSYVAALERGWSPNNLRPEAGQEELVHIARDAPAFLAIQVDRKGKGPPVILPDGSTARRLPGYRRWMWDGEFCGIIGFRWQPGSNELPTHVLGHIGFNVVPWKRQRGYATRALSLLLPGLRETGLEYVELTTDPDNVASQRVIAANGGHLVERFTQPAAYGSGVGLRFRIYLETYGNPAR